MHRTAARSSCRWWTAGSPTFSRSSPGPSSRPSSSTSSRDSRRSRRLERKEGPSENRCRHGLPDGHRPYLHGGGAAAEDRKEARPHHQGGVPGSDGARERAEPGGHRCGGGGHLRDRHRPGAAREVCQDPEGRGARAGRLETPGVGFREDMSLEYSFTCPLPQGVHARPASALEDVARHFTADISILNERTGHIANAKSVLAIVGIDIRLDDRCRLIVDGAGEGTALDALTLFLEQEFPRCDEVLPPVQ